ncbi:DUF1904 family protein [Paenibacillus rigui]|uniref:DUF1904 domain-containing protein n=1 Tax=Paenibacillus rigui TaxID=554312 RepID=A0A229UG89_9BACL|nr:DUF1904 family protein [Paenibacillus rigui]OXM82392.1 hypothetical protein CF651_31275 [Paenibacillus rigui]
MPHLVCRGLSVEQVRTISKPLLEELAVICECDTSNFMLECLTVTSVFDGDVVNTYPFIEVGWFDRGQSIRDLVAKAITEHCLASGVPEVEVAFRTYREDSYYTNGQHYGN